MIIVYYDLAASFSSFFQRDQVFYIFFYIARCSLWLHFLQISTATWQVLSLTGNNTISFSFSYGKQGLWSTSKKNELQRSSEEMFTIKAEWNCHGMAVSNFDIIIVFSKSQDICFSACFASDTYTHTNTHKLHGSNIWTRMNHECNQ